MSPRQNQVLDHDLLVFHPLGLPLQVASSLMWTTSQNARLPVPPPKGKAIYGQVHTILATIAIGIGTIDWMCILNDYLITSKKTVLVVIQLPCSSKAFNLMWVWCGDGKTSIPAWVVPLTKASASEVNVMTKSLFHAKYVCTLVVFWWYIHGFFCLGLVSVDLTNLHGTCKCCWTTSSWSLRDKGSPQESSPHQFQQEVRMPEGPCHTCKTGMKKSMWWKHLETKDEQHLIPHLFGWSIFNMGNL